MSKPEDSRRTIVRLLAVSEAALEALPEEDLQLLMTIGRARLARLQAGVLELDARMQLLAALRSVPGSAFDGYAEPSKAGIKAALAERFGEEIATALWRFVEEGEGLRV